MLELAFGRDRAQHRLNPFDVPVGGGREQRFQIGKMVKHQPQRDPGPLRDTLGGWTKIALLDERQQRIDDGGTRALASHGPSVAMNAHSYPAPWMLLVFCTAREKKPHLVADASAAICTSAMTPKWSDA